MSAIADFFTGGDEIGATANRAAADINFDPFNIQAGPAGSVGAAPGGGLSVGGSQLESDFGQLLTQLGGGFFQSAGAGQDPRGAQNLRGAGAIARGGLAGIGSQFGEQAGGFLGAGRQALEQLGSFNPDEFASNQFERLNRLAAPGETSQTRGALQNLFSRGRLGQNDTLTGEVGRNLDLSQSLARDARLGQSIGLAGQESDRLAGRANVFGALGGQFLGQQGQSFLDRFGVAGAALQGGQQFNQGQTSQGLDIINLLRGIRQDPLALLGSSLAGSAGTSTAAQARGQLQVQGATETANSRGNFFSGLASSVIPRI